LGRPSWKKGLNANSDPRVAKSKATLKEGYLTGRLIPSQLGKKHTEEEKKRISAGMKNFLREHPDRVPYVLNHHSKGDSYPEKYFRSCLDNASIEYEKDYKALSYFLDFAWPKCKCYIEIDGEQHYVDETIIKHDKIRTEKLENDGWKCLERVRWKSFKNLNREEQSEFIHNLIEKIKQFIEIM
jgi:very-short-patch-repair endonuclease